MDILLDPEDLHGQMARDVRDGLTQMPKSLPPKYFYDAHGSQLFDRITRLEEYYPTRTERQILRANATAIAKISRAQTLIELGSGTAEKTRLLLTALQAGNVLRRFVPFDVDPDVLASAAAEVAADFSGLEVAPIVGDFERHLSRLPGGEHRLLAFLGSTIGNLVPAERGRFLRSVRGVLGNDDRFLLGTDLVKAPERLITAYNDSAGVTAAFNKNVLTVLNRDLGADFDPTWFEHVAVWDADQEWIEMRLRSRRSQTIRIAELDLTVDLAAGEEIRTEISAKFRRSRVHDELAAAGLELQEWWTDPAGDFALSLSGPVRP